MIHVRFIGAAGNYQSIETQAVRIHKSLETYGAGRIRSQLTLLPQELFQRRGLLRRLPAKEIEKLVDGMNVLVVVKSSLFKDFLGAAPLLKEACRKRGVVLVSNPCDGPGADTGDTSDEFTEKIADHAIAVSRLQGEAIARVRPAEEVFVAGHASRLETTNCLKPRERVKQVMWENAIHHNPRYDQRKVGMPREKFQELEDLLRSTLKEHGAELVFIEAWRETQTYADWERMMLESDIAVECKALGSQYVDYQSQKPAVKVINYMSLGLPVICDPLPAYRELGEDGKELLFADSLDGWRAQLTRLLEDFPLRQRLGEAARKASEPYHISNMARSYIGFFEKVAGRVSAGAVRA